MGYKKTIESEIAEAIKRFNWLLKNEENVQQKIHDIVLGFDEGMCLTDEEEKLTKNVLNAFLSLTFTLKNRPQDLDKFLNYH